MTVFIISKVTIQFAKRISFPIFILFTTVGILLHFTGSRTYYQSEVESECNNSVEIINLGTKIQPSNICLRICENKSIVSLFDCSCNEQTLLFVDLLNGTKSYNLTLVN